MKHISVSEHFTFGKLIRISLPTIAMMIFMSIYWVIDGLFVSNFVGETSFAAINFVYPVILIIGAVGSMFGTGGSALIQKLIGEGNKERASNTFSLITYAGLIFGFILGLGGIFLLGPIVKAMGASEAMADDCVLYGRIICGVMPFYVLQFQFQSLFPAAERPRIGLVVTICAGCTNIIFDALFIVGFKWGVAGAASSTALSQFVGGVIPLIYFSCKNKSLFRLGKIKLDWNAFGKVCLNGCSEFLTNISMSFVGILYNIQLMKYIGENGVSAYGVLMYVSMVFMGIFVGYTMGIAPIISYNYGAKRPEEIKSILVKSLIFIWITSVIMFVLGEALARPMAELYVGYDPELRDLTIRAFYFFSISFIFVGMAIFGSSFFTALNNGVVSAIISFLRTLVFQVLAVMLLPLAFGVDGIWSSLIVAEFMAAFLSSIFIFAYRKRYGY